jgi:hypothetical protein
MPRPLVSRLTHFLDRITESLICDPQHTSIITLTLYIVDGKSRGVRYSTFDRIQDKMAIRNRANFRRLGAHGVLA